eukprot:m.227824 g.227824  ORF g.227824 m.227824 type:complete len:155 (+) comp11649_c0_seq1:25-489(+)
MATPALRRISADIKAVIDQSNPAITNLESLEDNIYVWTGVLLPASAPYDKGAFKFTITFPAEYPFKPPEVKFNTPIYHVNVDEKENLMCLPITTAAEWKPTMRMTNVFDAILKNFEQPNLSHPVRADLGELYTKDRATYNKRAEEHIKKNALKR